MAVLVVMILMNLKCETVLGFRKIHITSSVQKGVISRIISGPGSSSGESADSVGQHSSLLSDREHVYELVTHTTKPGEMDNYLSVYQDYAKTLEKAESSAVLEGSWRVVVGNLDQAVHLWRHTDGYDASDRIMQAQIMNPDLRKAMNEHGKLCSKRINALILSFSFWPTPQPRDPSHIYELRSYILKPGQMIEWGNNWARGISYRQDHNQPVGGFFSQVGRLYMVFHMWAYKDLTMRKKIREETWLKPGWDVNVTYTVPLIRRMRSRIMVPNDFSPMK